MCFNTKKFLLLFLFLSFYLQVRAQDSTVVSTQNPIENPVGLFSAGVYWAQPVGSSFVNDGLDLKPGFALQLRAYVLPRFTVGGVYNFMRAEVSDQRVTGNYDRTNIWLLGGTVGYEFNLPYSLNFLLTGGVGSAVYRNKKGSVRFTDRGMALWLTPEISYSLAKNISFYLAPEYRFDRLHINVPEEAENYFKHINYFSIGAGFRFEL